MSGRRFFLLLVLLDSLHVLFLIFDHRMPRGHDTWQYYSTQFAFLANAAQGDGVACWMPYLTQGTATTWHQVWQGGFVQQVLLLAGPLFRGANFLPLFYLGLFFDELLFLSGVWLLARRYYKAPSTAFFVSVAAAGSVLWTDQIWYNFHAFYAVPLILAWVHDFLEHGTRWKLFAAADLFLVQTYGNLPYLPVMTGLVLLFYGASELLVFRRRIRFDHFRPRPLDALGIALCGGVAALLYLSVKSGTDQNVIQTLNRNPDGTTRLDDFLVYGGETSPVRYLEFLHGVSPSFNATLFCGFFTPAFAALALLYRPGRRTLQLLLALTLTLLFSCGFLEAVAPSAYVLIPGMRYFRHVAYIAPFVKLFVIFLAGLGFEGARRRFQLRGRPGRTAGILLLTLAAALAILAFSPPLAGSFANKVEAAMGHAPAAPSLTDPGLLSRRLLLSAAGAAGAGLLLLLSAWKPAASPVWTAILAVHALQVFGWQLDIVREKTLRLDPAQYALQELRPLPYVSRRSADYASNPRYRALEGALFRGADGAYGTMSWTADAYLFQDAPSSRFRTTDWMAPLDELMRAYTGQPIHDRSQPLSAWGGYRLNFPLQHPAAARVIGLETDKIQIFSGAHRMGSPAPYLTAPDFLGDLLLLDGVGYGAIPSISANERLDVPYEVLEFAANHLRVKTTVPQNAWLLYCDVWHPSWKAEVNGKAVPVVRGQIAYKAVPLEAGENVVEFRFRAPTRTICFVANAIHAGLWILLVLGMIFKVFQEKPLQATAPCYN